MEIEEIYNLLTKDISKEQILRNELMSKHTSFKIGGPVDIFLIAKKEEDLKKALRIAKENNITTVILGNGSNMLVKDKRYKRYCYKTRI